MAGKMDKKGAHPGEENEPLLSLRVVFTDADNSL